MSAEQLSVTHTSSVTADQIDELGHMNVRYYGQNAVAGTQALGEQLGLGEPDITSSYTRHHHEQLEGNALEVRSAIIATSTQLQFFHELRNRDTDDLAATFIHTLANPPVEGAEFEVPNYGQARSIDLNVDRLASAPTIGELRSRGLEMRLERQVSTEDSMGADVVPAWLTNNLLWNGESLEESESWINDTDDGDRVAFASMETHLRIARPVAVGTRIQSFSATIDIGDKILHELNWVFDLDTDQVLAAAETIDLAFSIPKRRARSIPPEVRANEEKRFYPDLDQ